MLTTNAFDLAALDMAGTTIDDGGAVYAALRGAVEDQIDAPLDDDVVQRWTGTSKREAVAGLLLSATGAAPAPTVAAVYQNFAVRLTKAYAATPPRPLPGVSAAMEEMRGRGVKVILQTGYSREVATSILDAMGWQQDTHIDGMVTTDEVRTSRPAPYLIFHAMELAGVHSPERVLVAGDTANDLLAGSNAGARFVVGVLTGAYDAATLGAVRHTHLLPSAANIPALLRRTAS